MRTHLTERGQGIEHGYLVADSTERDSGGEPRDGAAHDEELDLHEVRGALARWEELCQPRMYCRA